MIRDHELSVEREERVAGLTVRVCLCECRPDCEERLLLVAEDGMVGLQGAPLPLWLVAGFCTARSTAQMLGAMAEAEAMGLGARKALLIYGALWEKVRWRGEALRQATATAAAPEGIFGVPDDTILRTRAVVFGDDFTRTERALMAVAEVGGDRGGVQPEVGPNRRAWRVRGSAPMRLAVDEDADGQS